MKSSILEQGKDENMGLLDFIKNRNVSVAPKPQEHRPESARESFSSDGAPQKAQPEPAEQIPEANRTAVKSIRERIGQAQPAANAQQQTAESAKEQAKPDRILESLERAQGSRLPPTPNQIPDGTDVERLARAERFVDASARPKREEPPPMRWPRQRGSWER